MYGVQKPNSKTQLCVKISNYVLYNIILYFSLMMVPCGMKHVVRLSVII